MKVLLIKPPYQTSTANLGVGHQVPLRLLTVGGPLRDAGHEVRLLGAERRRRGARAVRRWTWSSGAGERSGFSNTVAAGSEEAGF